MEKKGGKIILHLTSKDASNLPPSFFERYNVEDNGKGYYGTSYIVSKKTTYAEGGRLEWIQSEPTLDEAEKVRKKLKDSGEYYRLLIRKNSPKRRSLGHGTFYRIWGEKWEKGGSTYAEGGDIGGWETNPNGTHYNLEKGGSIKSSWFKGELSFLNW